MTSSEDLRHPTRPSSGLAGHPSPRRIDIHRTFDPIPGGMTDESADALRQLRRLSGAISARLYSLPALEYVDVAHGAQDVAEGISFIERYFEKCFQVWMHPDRYSANQTFEYIPATRPSVHLNAIVETPHSLEYREHLETIKMQLEILEHLSYDLDAGDLLQNLVSGVILPPAAQATQIVTGAGPETLPGGGENDIESSGIENEEVARSQAHAVALGHIARLKTEIDDRQQALGTAVADARSVGLSWARIGRVLEVTPQAAMRRFDARAREKYAEYTRARSARSDQVTAPEDPDTPRE